MLILTIKDEKCPNCQAVLLDRTVTIRVPRTDEPCNGTPWMMEGNTLGTDCYAEWHHTDFQKTEESLLTTYCGACGINIIFNFGVISKFVKHEDTDTYFEHLHDLTFLQWLKQQVQRSDIVGSFAQKFIDTKKATSKEQYRIPVPKDTNNYVIMREYIASWPNTEGWLKGFDASWKEFFVLYKLAS